MSDYGDDEALSQCSFLSEGEGQQAWSGWSHGSSQRPSQALSTEQTQRRTVDSLADLATRFLASHTTLEAMEQRLGLLGFSSGLEPEAFQMRMIRECFPASDKDIRLYSVLSTGTTAAFEAGHRLYGQRGAVRDLLQIGSHLSARVGGDGPGEAGEVSVALTVDRCRITSCTCSCSRGDSWCCHVVAVCLHRIHRPGDVAFRAPLSDSLAQLGRVGASEDRTEDLLAANRRLQKLVQYLIQALPREVLPTTQALLDELKDPDSEKNRQDGAPDPTFGGGRDEVATWRIDSGRLAARIAHKLGKLCKPQAVVCSDVAYLSSPPQVPPAHAEWKALVKPLQGNDSSGIGNYLDMIGELLKRRDENGPDLLHILTKQLLGTPQLLIWWLGTKLAQSGRWLPPSAPASKSGITASGQFTVASIADRIVGLWRLVALNPRLESPVRASLIRLLKDFHRQVVKSVTGILEEPQGAAAKGLNLGRLSLDSARFDLDSFPGFAPALTAALSDWDDCPIPGVTLSSRRRLTEPLGLEELEERVEGVSLSPRPRCSASPSSLPVLRPQPPHHILVPRKPTASEPQPAPEASETASSPSDLDPRVQVELELGALGPMADARELRFSRCEALHAHGFAEEAWTMAAELAEEMLAHPPDLMRELPPRIKVPPSAAPGASGAPTSAAAKKKRRNGDESMAHPVAVAISAQASRTLEKASFLCDVLLRGPNRANLAFRVGLLGLETPRQAAATKFLEVKMHLQERELAAQLGRLSLGQAELEMVRERARRLIAEPCEAPVLPFALANFVHSVLALPRAELAPQPADQELGFEAAVRTLGLRTTVSEAEHPILCEGIRQQRSALALALFSRYKDDQAKLDHILSTVLDPEMHQIIPTARAEAGKGGRADGPAAVARSFSGVSELSAEQNDELIGLIERETGGVELCSEVELVEEVPEELDAASDSSSSGGLRTGPPSRKASSQGLCQLRQPRPALHAPTLPHQASKAQAYFMMEISKALLSEAGGSQNNAIFNAPANLPAQANPAAQAIQPHAGLHIAAFKIGLYSLGLDNKVSHNWLSRTYSHQASWLSGQAQEIGRTAIRILIQCWEGHLTPTEAAEIADKASQCQEEGMAEASAQLALAVLPHAGSLAVQDTKRALIQCKDQGRRMLEQACVAVERAALAKDFAVSPEVLFEVARHWNWLYKQECQGEGGLPPQALAQPPPQPSPAQLAHQQHQLAALHQQHQLQQQLHAVAAQQQQQQQLHHQQGYGAYPQGYYQAPPNAQLYHQLHQMAGGGGYPAAYGASGYPQQQLLRAQHMGGPYQQLSPQQQAQAQQAQQAALLYGRGQAALHLSHSAPALLPQGSRPGGHHSHQGLHLAIPTVLEMEQEQAAAVAASSAAKALLCAFRVGRLALETMGRRIADERAYTKFCQNPAYGDDVNFLLGVGKQLGPAHSRRFFHIAGQSIVSPFVLWELSREAAGLLVPSAPPGGLHGLQHPIVGFLVERSLQMFHEAAGQKLSHPRFLASDTEEVLALVREAQRCFHQVLGGKEKFQAFLDFVFKQKAASKKDLRSKINAALSSPQQ